jgi:RNA recognition motif-containing protein
MGTKLYVGNIPFKATEDDLTELFAQAGSVQSVNLVTDPHTGQPRGFGFVEMASDGEARKAVESLNGSVFMERTLTVDEARPPKQRERGLGGGGGGRGGYGGGRDDRSGRGRR